MTLTEVQPRPQRAAQGSDEFDYARAVLNILEDSASDRERLQHTQSAVLNILEDAAEEKSHLEEMKKAVLNILEDLAIEKNQLQQTQQEVVKSAEAIRLSLREKETLLKEIHHRVKNNLQVIVSLLRLQSRRLPDEQSRRMFDDSQNRVHSISLVHEMLYRSGNLARVDFNDYLRTLVRSLLDGWKGTADAINITVNASGVQLAVDTAIPCGLIVNELVTNALKHAFPQGRAGTIQVEAIMDSSRWLKLTIQDDGVGIRENLDLRRAGSLGLELVATLVRQLHAKIDMRRGSGTAFEISFQAEGIENA